MQTDSFEDFRKQCERNLRRSVAERLRYGFNYVYKPVLDDAEWRAFDSMEDYRNWCQQNLPSYLGYGHSDAVESQVRDEA